MTLHCGDSLAYLQTLPDNSVDAVVTDPPYFNYIDAKWDRQWPNADAYLLWLGEILDQFQRVLKSNGSLYLFASPKMACRVEVEISKRFNVLNQIVWCKPTDKGQHMRPHKEGLRSYFPNTERIIFAEHYGADGAAKKGGGYEAACEQANRLIFEPLIAYFDGERKRRGYGISQIDKLLGFNGMAGHWFTRHQWEMPTKRNYERLQAVFNGNGGDYLRREYEDLRREYEDLRREYEDLRREYEDLRREYEDLRRPFAVDKTVQFTDVWQFTSIQPYKGKHPCEKPVDLLRHILRTSTRPRAVVLDAFMGTGSTGLACQAEGRDFIGIEIADHYFRQAEARLQTFGSQALPHVPQTSPVSKPETGQPITLF